MRNTIAAAAVAMIASSGSAFAADCTKGLLWPYVRNPGDCLTEQEIKTGVYQGAPQGPVDVGNIPSPMQPAMPITAQDCHETGIWPFRSEECTTVVKAGATVSAPPAPQPAVASTPAAPAPVAQSVTPAVATQTSAAPSAASCSKGLLWPFVRDSGDCPTEVEKSSGVKPPATAPASATVSASPAAMLTTAQDCHETGIWPFRSEECTTVVKAAATVSAPPAAQPAVASTPAVPAPVAQSAPPAVVTQTSAAPSAGSCSKGLLWPFVRDSGDCPTEVEKTSGVKTPVAATANTTVAATPAAMITMAQNCHETGIWPFRSEECAPVVTGATNSPPPALQPAVSASTTAAPTPVAQSAPPAAASCSKGLLWPFVRESGDCATEADKGRVSTSAAPASTEPAVVPASATMPPPPAASQPTAAPTETGCHKGLFWPFVREPGDCPTSADQGQTRSGRS